MYIILLMLALQIFLLCSLSHPLSGPCCITVALGQQGSLSLFKHIHPGYLDLSGLGHKALSFFKNTTRVLRVCLMHT